MRTTSALVCVCSHENHKAAESAEAAAETGGFRPPCRSESRYPRLEAHNELPPWLRPQMCPDFSAVAKEIAIKDSELQQSINKLEELENPSSASLSRLHLPYEF